MRRRNHLRNLLPRLRRASRRRRRLLPRQLLLRQPHRYHHRRLRPSVWHVVLVFLRIRHRFEAIVSIRPRRQLIDNGEMERMV